jgi:protein phosphatase
MTWVLAAIVAVVAFVLLVRLLSGGQAAPPVVAASSPPKPKLASKPPGARAESGKKSGGKKNGTKAKRQEPKPEKKTETPSATPPVAPASIRPLSMPPPPNDFDNDWDDVDVTMVAELPDEIKALQKGFRSVDPKEAVAQVAKEAYDDTAEIEVVEERMVDGLLVEELLSDEDTGPNALVFPVGVVQSDVGRRRPNNEDRPLDMPEHFVFGVADGMGGHAAGEVASKIAMDTLEQAFKDNAFEGEANSLWPRRGDELARSIEMANRAIYQVACEDDSLSGMGTTLTAIRFSPERQRAYVAHVGDSRCYRFRDGEMRQLTKDHTLGAELGAKGKMATHLSRSVGISESVEVDLMVDAPRVGDRYLLCTDGLTKMLTEDRIQAIVTEGEISACVQGLIDEANENGGKDNITVALIEIRDPAGAGMV